MVIHVYEQVIDVGDPTFQHERMNVTERRLSNVVNALAKEMVERVGSELGGLFSCGSAKSSKGFQLVITQSYLFYEQICIQEGKRSRWLDWGELNVGKPQLTKKGCYGLNLSIFHGKCMEYRVHGVSLPCCFNVGKE